MAFWIITIQIVSGRGGGLDELEAWSKSNHYPGVEASLIVTKFFSANKQYVKIKLMQNETNSWSIFFGKDKILVKLWFKGLNYHNFHIFYHN